MKSFKYWKRQEVQKTFGLKRVKKMALLNEWLDVDVQSIKNKEREQIEELRVYLSEHVIDWNEATLKFLFLGPFVRLVNFHSDYYNPFLEYKLTAKIDKEEVSGNVDFMVAQGEQIPEAPFFCLHEYKPEEGTSNDPFGQLLIAMVAAQQVNEKMGLKMPIYGAYVLGRYFNFVLLDKKQYILSPSYDATQTDIFEIFAILRKTKMYIDDFILNVLQNIST